MMACDDSESESESPAAADRDQSRPGHPSQSRSASEQFTAGLAEADDRDSVTRYSTVRRVTVASAPARMRRPSDSGPVCLPRSHCPGRPPAARRAFRAQLPPCARRRGGRPGPGSEPVARHGTAAATAASRARAGRARPAHAGQAHAGPGPATGKSATRRPRQRPARPALATVSGAAAAGTAPGPASARRRYAI